MKKFFLGLIIFSVIFILSCGGGFGGSGVSKSDVGINGGGGNNASVTINVSGGSNANISRSVLPNNLNYTATFSRSGRSSITASSNGGSSIKATIPEGTYNVKVEAFDNGTLYGSGSVSGFQAKAGQTNSVTIQMSQTTPPGGTCSHTWSAWTASTPATCNATGTGTRTCTICGITDPNTTIPMIAHDYGAYTQTTDPTCTTAGIQTRTCNVCPAVYTVTQPGDPVLGHNWNWATHAIGSGLRQCQRTGCTVTAGNGDTGPAGGIIFYRSETGFNLYQGTDETLANDTYTTAYYLEAWTANETDSWWSSAGFDIPLVGQLHNTSNPTQWIGYGLRNTRLIVAELTTNGQANRAAQVASTTKNGFSDWFLPSTDELYAMYNAKAAGVTGLPQSG
ncbi:MAG: hypothetical protein FWD24_03420, partial [Treponema sp.]|nr:hypothetical protein [Treponema sp.]